MIPNKYLAVITYGTILVAIILGFGQYREHRGYVKGVDFTHKQQALADAAAEKKMQQEKENVENAYRSEIIKIQRDRDIANDESKRLRTEISNIRGIVSKATGTQSSGETTSKIAVLLAELLDKSVSRNENLAGEAEKYRSAGELCERQYDAVRGGN